MYYVICVLKEKLKALNKEVREAKQEINSESSFNSVSRFYAKCQTSIAKIQYFQ